MKGLVFIITAILLVVFTFKVMVTNSGAKDPKSMSLLCRSFAKAATELDEPTVENLAKQIGQGIIKIARKHKENPEQLAKAFCDELATGAQEVMSTVPDKSRVNAILELLVKGYNIIISTAREEKI